jgi:hypothetical protein
MPDALSGPARRNGGKGRDDFTDRSDHHLAPTSKKGGFVPFDNIISCSGGSALIPEDVVDDVIQAAATQSAALALLRRVDMGTTSADLPVPSALARASWVNGDIGLKQTTEESWRASSSPAKSSPRSCLSPRQSSTIRRSTSGSRSRRRHRSDRRRAPPGRLLPNRQKLARPAAIVAGATAAGNSASQGTSTVEEGTSPATSTTRSTSSKPTASTRAGLPPCAPCAACCAAPRQQWAAPRRPPRMPRSSWNIVTAVPV